MSAAYGLAALGLGLLGFAAIEAAGRVFGVRTAMGPSLWLDAAAFALTTLLLAAIFAPLLRRARGWRTALVVIGFMLLYAPLTGLLAGALDLTVSGTWAQPSLLRGALIATPINLIVTFTLDLAFVALPLGVASVLALRHLVRGQRELLAQPRRGGRAAVR